jgi:23S rRNA pseudouridine2457 synthase
MAIGRLDEPSEGLIILTTDGKMSEYFRSSTIEKEYLAQVDGLISEEAIQRLASGVEIGINGRKYTTKKCKVKPLVMAPEIPPRGQKIRDSKHGPTSWVSITLTEGKFRQVRKMTAVVGFPTLRLVRVRIGEYNIGNLKAGEFRELVLNKI